MSIRAAGIFLSVLGIVIWADFYESLLGQEKDVKLRSVQYKDYKMQLLQNSETLSLAIAINSSGSVIGYKEVPNEEKTIFRNVFFFCGKLRSKDMPLPKGFTNIEATAISDNNRVVGRATRPIGAKDGSLRAVVWNAESDEQVQLLPRPEGDLSCDAQDVSADGTRITGYATGPDRLRPVLWSWNEQQMQWSITLLPVIHEFNPYLMSAQLIISPDGKTIVGCCTEKFLSDGSVDSGLYMWQQQEGQWNRKLITSEQMYVKAINNKGQIAGSAVQAHGRMPCLITLDGTLQMLQLLPGDVSGEARDINEKSEIVGWSDDPPGTEGGPVACRWKPDGSAFHIELSESGYGSVYSINNEGQLAGMVDLVIPGEDDKPENTKSLVLAFRTIKQ